MAAMSRHRIFWLLIACVCFFVACQASGGGNVAAWTAAGAAGADAVVGSMISDGHLPQGLGIALLNTIHSALDGITGIAELKRQIAEHAAMIADAKANAITKTDLVVQGTSVSAGTLAAVKAWRGEATQKVGLPEAKVRKGA